jgi:flagellin
LQTVLQQLSSGSRINSGADDSAGLSLVNGLEANSTALTQSETNATEGVGLLDVADGALSQVTNLLDRAITLATEASNGTLNSTQESAANQEYQSILSEINNIGSTTTYNQEQVFAGNTIAIYTGDSSTTGSSIDNLNIRTLSSSPASATRRRAIAFQPEAPARLRLLGLSASFTTATEAGSDAVTAASSVGTETGILITGTNVGATSNIGEIGTLTDSGSGTFSGTLTIGGKNITLGTPSSTDTLADIETTINSGNYGATASVTGSVLTLTSTDSSLQVTGSNLSDSSTSGSLTWAAVDFVLQYGNYQHRRRI